MRFAWLVAVLGMLSCFDEPRPACTFLCGADDACPDGYACATDGICKRNDVADDFDCDAEGLPDAGGPDGPVSPVCGDSTTDSPEACDDGDTTTETECAYGTASCTLCNGDCTAELELTGRVCGDDVNDAEETCDDGNTTTETECAYGATSDDSLNCTLCNDVCDTELSLTGPYCGDNLTQGGEGEVCDDNNADGCGRCSGDCQSVAGVVASGTIDTSGAIADGNTVIVADADTSVTFEYDAAGDGLVNGGATAFGVGEADKEAVATDLALKINESGLFVTADANTTTVTVTYGSVGTVGNVAMAQTGDTFVVTGLSGGTGTACGAGEQCGDGVDCASGACLSNECAPVE